MIKIGGKERPVRFGFNALIEFERQAGKPMLGIDFQNMGLEDMRAMVYAGLLHGAKYEKQEVDFSVEDVGEWIGDDMNVLTKFIESLTESMPKPGK